MHHLLAANPATDAAHDSGVLELSILSARLAFALMCLSLTWGVLTSMGWVTRFTGRQALRSGHMILATLTLAFAGVHAVSFLMLDVLPFRLEQVLLPFADGMKFRHAMGTLALEGMLAASVAIGLRRWMSYWRWLWLHRLAYPAFGAGVVHALMSAIAGGSLSAVWLGGIVLLVPALAVAALRLIPARALATTGLIEDLP